MKRTMNKKLGSDRFGSIRFGVNSRPLTQPTQSDYKIKEYKRSPLKKLQIDSGLEYITKSVTEKQDSLEVILELDVEYLSDTFTKKEEIYSIEIKNKGELLISTNKDILSIDNKLFHDEILLPKCYKDIEVILNNNVICCRYKKWKKKT